MPEGDTLRRLANRINERLAGDLVVRSEVRDPRLVGVELAGRRLVDADAYGKHLFVRFDDGRSLHAHLLMSGSFAVGPSSREPEWKRRIELWLERGRLTGESVPLLGMIATADEHELTDHLGPDLCAVAGAPDPAVVVSRLLRAPTEPLTGALLDQRNVAGFGNIYVNDVPFVVGLHPMQPVGAIDGLAEVVAIGAALIRTNARLGPQNTTGRRLRSDDRWVHGAGRRPCPVCGTRLEHRSERATPWRRPVTWCPDCQQPPADDRRPADLDRARRLLALHPAVREPVFPR
jgi:formamidopyrimidine-DNA glycosylase